MKQATTKTQTTITLHPAATGTLETSVAQALQLHDDLTRQQHALEEELAAVRQKHRPALERLSQALDEARGRARAWAEDYRPYLQERRSLTIAGARLGFRRRPPRLERRNAKQTWERVAARLGKLDWAARYLRTPEPPPAEVDKKALLADRAKLTKGQLAAAGLRIVQDETFYIEPEPATTPARERLRAAA